MYVVGTGQLAINKDTISIPTLLVYLYCLCIGNKLNNIIGVCLK